LPVLAWLEEYRVKAVKIIALAILSILLFVSLFLFGTALTINSTLLNRDFIPNEIDRMNIGGLVNETISQPDAGMSGETRDAIVRAVMGSEPHLKAQIRAGYSQIYDYLLGRTYSLDLRGVLRSTVLDPSFVASIVDDADVLSLVRRAVRDELVKVAPIGQSQFASYLDQAMPGIDQWLKQQIDSTTGPVIDYILGDMPGLRAEIALQPMKTALRQGLREAFLRAPPPELAALPPAGLESFFGNYYELFATQIPETLVIDQTTLGIGQPGSASRAIADAEDGLASARKAVAYFRACFVIVTVLMAIWVAGIVLIHREVRGASRDLGIAFLSYGVVELAGLLIAGAVIRSTDMSGVAAAVGAWLPGLYWDATLPLLIFSIASAAVGLGLLLLSLLYPRKAAI
jgi:hypothetical protein